MSVSAAVCPAPPLLVRELTGRALILPGLRDACAAAVAHLIAGAPDLVIVVGPADVTAPLDASARLDLSAYAPALRVRDDPASGDPAGSDPAGSDPAGGDPAGKASLPLAVGVGAMLLGEAGYDGPRILQGIAAQAPPDACGALGRDLAAAAPRVALLVMGEGTARRSVSAPGYLDERAEPFDAAVERAIRDGDLEALAALDPVLAGDLMATGRPAWQVLAGALAAAPAPVSPQAAARHRTRIRYSDAPFGVAYLVATLDPER